MATTNDTDAGIVDFPLNPSELLEQSIFTLLKIDGIPQDQKDKMAEGMMETIQTRVLARILDSLDEAGVEEFSRLVDQEDHGEVQSFLERHDIEVSSLMAEEAMLYKTEVVALVRSGQLYPQQA
jgi:hypothetical protein